jgi:hypothetical protein
VPNIRREHGPQVSLAKDQHTVGEFGSEDPYESFGETVCSRTARRNSHHVNAGIGENSVERRGELTGSVSDEEPELGEAIAKVHDQVTDLLGSPPAIGIRSRAQQVHRPVADLQHEKHVDPLERHRTVHLEEVTRQHGRCLGA